MARRFWLLTAGFVTVSLSPRLAWAQLTVQQPVIGVTGVATTVSVPDRGRAHLGSISRARDSRIDFGPLHPGSSIGLDREHSGMSVGVFIHDFEAMDQHLLNQGKARSNAPALTGNARHAWEQLSAAHRRSTTPTSSIPPTPRSAFEPSDKAEKYWRLGQEAEREGRLSVAKLHYRIASQYGSQAAKVRLARWNAAGPNQVAKSNE